MSECFFCENVCTYRDSCLSSFNEERIRKDEREKVIHEIETQYAVKASDLYKSYSNDKENVPRPTFASSVALVVAICESLKEQK